MLCTVSDYIPDWRHLYNNYCLCPTQTFFLLSKANDLSVYTCGKHVVIIDKTVNEKKNIAGNNITIHNW